MLWIQMIVRNEADRHLERALVNIKEIRDFTDAVLRVTDDASTDDTITLCERYDAEVQWTPEPLFWQHEGRARQRAYDYATNDAQDGDWVLSLDADETLSNVHLLPGVIEQAENGGYGAVGLPLLEFWAEDQYRIDGFWHGTRTPRLYRWQSNGKINDRQMGCGSEPAYVQRVSHLYQDDVELLHWGYLHEVDRVRKHAAYTERLGGHGHNNLHVQSIITVPTLATYQGEA